MNPFLRHLLDQRAAIQERSDAVLTRAQERITTARAAAADGSTVNDELTDEEYREYTELQAELRPIDERIAALQDAEERGATAARAAAPIQGPAVVRSEPLTYSKHEKRRSFLLDMARSQIAGDQEAYARLRRHRDEMAVEIRALEAEKRSSLDSFLGEFAEGAASAQDGRRDLDRLDTTGGEFVPPLWLMELYADAPRGSRPFADVVRNVGLPTGTDSINIPRIVSGGAVAAQTADNAAVNETDPVTNSVSAPVITEAGQIDLALQLLEQSPMAFDEIMFADLMADLDAKIDVQCLNGSAANGQVRGILNVSGINAVTYTDLTPTVPELHPKFADAINQAGTNRKRPPTVAIMAFRRWLWELSAVDTVGRPLVTPAANALNPLALASGLGVDGPVGGQLLVPVIADVNMPTNLGAGTDEDRIIVTKADDHVLFEGVARARVLPEIGSGNLTVRLQVYKYLAFTAARYPSGTSVIAGTGLVTPTF